MAGGIRDRFKDDLEDNHEINVTPFIDVMLVLLIIFMVAAPLATVDVHVDLPASTAPPAPPPDKPVYLTLKQDLTLNLGNDPVPRERLQAAIESFTGGNKDARVFLRAGRTVDYQHLMEVMNLLREASYLKVALVGLEAASASKSEPDEARPSPAVAAP
ncbi:TonB system transport protein ExbD [Bradyrhizobium sp. 31Argb]|uniref:TonB system transport protein ExbD n=1 Tax=Bradyrhizobium TaxID=374 RepID=UPI000405C11B|nr:MULTISPECIES: TonB system transport protein ExbD [Bradyrhizobium]RZN17034.1 TonB system transport protein ExbD [Bradyrhizobium sp. Leo121]